MAEVPLLWIALASAGSICAGISLRVDATENPMPPLDTTEFHAMAAVVEAALGAAMPPAPH